MQQLKLKRVKKKVQQPVKPLVMCQLKINGMYFALYIDVEDRYFLKGNDKIYEIVNEITP